MTDISLRVDRIARWAGFAMGAAWLQAVGVAQAACPALAQEQANLSAAEQALAQARTLGIQQNITQQQYNVDVLNAAVAACERAPGVGGGYGGGYSGGGGGGNRTSQALGAMASAFGNAAAVLQQEEEEEQAEASARAAQQAQEQAARAGSGGGRTGPARGPGRAAAGRHAQFVRRL